MRRKNMGKTQAGLKRKLVLLIGLILFLISFLFYRDYMRQESKEAYGDRRKEEQKESRQKEEELIDVPNFGTPKPEEPATENATGGGTAIQVWPSMESGQPDSGNPKAPAAEKLSITNLEGYAAQVMGENKNLLEESLAGWVKEKNLAAGSGSIIHVLVPETDPQSIQYYIRLDDEKASLVMLAYHPRENVVTASSCSYTEEEIIHEVWSDNGPPQRDVLPEEDAVVNQETAGEQPGGEEADSENSGEN